MVQLHDGPESRERVDQRDRARRRDVRADRRRDDHRPGRQLARSARRDLRCGGTLFPADAERHRGDCGRRRGLRARVDERLRLERRVLLPGLPTPAVVADDPRLPDRRGHEGGDARRPRDGLPDLLLRILRPDDDGRLRLLPGPGPGRLLFRPRAPDRLHDVDHVGRLLCQRRSLGERDVVADHLPRLGLPDRRRQRQPCPRPRRPGGRPTDLVRTVQARRRRGLLHLRCPADARHVHLGLRIRKLHGQRGLRRDETVPDHVGQHHDRPPVLRHRGPRDERPDGGEPLRRHAHRGLVLRERCPDDRRQRLGGPRRADRHDRLRHRDRVGLPILDRLLDDRHRDEPARHPIVAGPADGRARPRVGPRRDLRRRNMARLGRSDRVRRANVHRLHERDGILRSVHGRGAPDRSGDGVRLRRVAGHPQSVPGGQPLGEPHPRRGQQPAFDPEFHRDPVDGPRSGPPHRPRGGHRGGELGPGDDLDPHDVLLLRRDRHVPAARIPRSRDRLDVLAVGGQLLRDLVVGHADPGGPSDRRPVERVVARPLLQSVPRRHERLLQRRVSDRPGRR